ncbi:SDR family NAD(P)-dependent oxidoreductase [Flammeovirga sp. MY04]|uniref:oxidoreductase n=1 Tax=Flammeovirga sp. MY04 TaxID=1191459 RepID=UPI0008060D57|nr:oxidoreductase [Flammeovirga sp. MY04]ANQ49518.1 SDR family NAD(P)-dependent oxidoreductase [Flammeovirga sp. MY04]
MNITDINQLPTQKGKVAIITGANVGLGLETARFLIQKDITIVMACRSQQKAMNARNLLLKDVPDARIDVILIDLNSLQSVRDFVINFTDKYDRLDYLINNAGLMIPPLQRTEEGFESQLGVNYLSHFLLTGLLLPILEKTENSRVVALGSLAHRKGKIDFKNLNWEKDYHNFKAYCQSKLACVMFGFELDRRLKKSKSSVTSVIAHPGASLTNLGRYAPALINNIVMKIGTPFLNSAAMGAIPTIHAALGEDIEGGDYIGPASLLELRGHASKKVKATKYAQDEHLAKSLWETSERLVHFNYPI